jgi:hypothetical protein
MLEAFAEGPGGFLLPFTHLRLLRSCCSARGMLPLECAVGKSVGKSGGTDGHEMLRGRIDYDVCDTVSMTLVIRSRGG